MALRDQPYLPLYVKDFTTDEKLIECSAAANGVYIRIMCLMHKTDPYGKIMLRKPPIGLPQQNEQQNKIFADCFADQLAKHLPFTSVVISDALLELLNEKVIYVELDGDYFLVQKRMVLDNATSLKRASSGKKGADKTNQIFAAAKSSANSVNANAIINTNESIGGMGDGDEDFEKLNQDALAPKMVKVFREFHPKYPIDTVADCQACLDMAYKIAKANGWTKEAATNGRMNDVLKEWRAIAEFTKTDKWYRTRSLTDINKEYQRLIQSINKSHEGNKESIGRTFTADEI
jgi:hypothetical protein